MPSPIPLSRRFDFNYIRPKVGKEMGAKRTRNVAGTIEYAQITEGGYGHIQIPWPAWFAGIITISFARNNSWNDQGPSLP
jgi:hypothetical protein